MTDKTATEETIKAAPAAAAADSSGVDWEKAPERLINIFYPGQASMEWVLGKNHSGKRAFKSGDRCFDCHNEETADMGELIVSGEHEYLPETETVIPVSAVISPSVYAQCMMVRPYTCVFNSLIKRTRLYHLLTTVNRPYPLSGRHWKS